MAPSPAIPDLLRTALGWPTAACHHVQTGENETWRVEGPHETVAVRLYRPGRRSRAEVAAEWAWARALGHAVRTPQPRSDILEVDGRLAVASEWLEGTPVDYADADHLRRLGHLAGTLQRAARATLASAAPDWAGRARERVDPAAALDAQVAAATAPDYATPARTDRLRALADRLAAAVDAHPPAAPAWVHADLHAWNVLLRGDALVLIDLDDCLFGPPALEWATPRIHLRARGDLDQTWPVFSGAAAVALGEPLDPTAVAVGTGLHLLATMAEFPVHLDMEGLERPGEVLDRYSGFLEAELDTIPG